MKVGKLVAIEPIALGIDDAAAAIGMSVSAFRALYRNGDIEIHYLTSKPVVLVADLRALVESAPTERAAS